jgi:hypothetical protein
VFKCTIDGATVYQSGPCPADAPRERPTVEQLNRERQDRRRAASAPDAIRPSAAPSALVPSPVAPTQPQPYRCDGRRYCSQMTSCHEAKFFLARCPGVQMDGDRDGIPCEQQWCR